MTSKRQSSEFERVHTDWLIDPYDLQEIMEDLRGEELSLEELALTLLQGGIEIEYLETKYKTSMGDHNLLMVIACQDSLEVDWEDLDRRYEKVLNAVVGDHIRRETLDGNEGLPTGEKPLDEIAHEAAEAGFHPDPQGYVALLKEDNKPVQLLAGGIAPKWEADVYAPDLHVRTGSYLSALDPGSGVIHNQDGSFHLRKGMVDILKFRDFPGTQLTTIREYSKMVRSDIAKSDDAVGYTRPSLGLYPPAGSLTAEDSDVQNDGDPD